MTPRLYPVFATFFLVASARPSAEDRLVETVAAAIRHNRLAPPACLAYRVVSEPQARDQVVLVLQATSKACGGDTGIDAPLFDVHVDRNTGKMTTSARDPGGSDESPLVP